MPKSKTNRLCGGMVGLGMIAEETYCPMFEELHANGLYRKDFGPVEVRLGGVATRTGSRAKAYKQKAQKKIASFAGFAGEDAVEKLAASDVDFVCVASPDDRHYDAARAALNAGKHVLIEKPSVLKISQLDDLLRLASRKKALAKVVYHKLLDPDHKKLRTLVADGELRHVNNGYCSLLEPRSISKDQFAEWIKGRNPGTYVAVHYIKLIDFTFGGRLKTVACSGQRGIVGDAKGDTWDSVQLRLTYEHKDGREAAFDIHTSWVTPDNFPGYVEQEVQFRFDNGVWNGHSRKRGVECAIEGRAKSSLNNHYNAEFLEPWGERSRRGYGVEVLRKFVEEVAFVEFGGPKNRRAKRLAQMRKLAYNDLSADRQVVAAVQAMEEILRHAAAGSPDGVVRIDPKGRMTLYLPGKAKPVRL